MGDALARVGLERTGPRDQFGLQGDVGLNGLAPDTLEKGFVCFTEVIGTERHRLDVVEADQEHVVGDLQAASSRRRNPCLMYDI